MAKLAIRGGKPLIGKRTKWADWPVFTKADETNLLKVLRGRRWCRIYDGSWVEAFEKQWAEFHGARHCTGVSNGTVSLQLALRALHVKAGDEVIVPAVTFIATATAVTELGAVPVFADIDVETGQISAGSIEERITPRTKGVIGVHFAGYPFDLDAVGEVCRSRGLFLIEDAAHAQGTAWKGRRVGAFGQFGSFSFQETKALASGEGGAVVTDDDGLHEEALLIHNIGRVVGRPGYLHYTLSSNYRLSEFAGALLTSQLKLLPRQMKVKEKNACFLRENLSELGLLPLKEDDRITERGYYFLALRYRKDEFGGVGRDRFLEALVAEGVPAARAYGHPLYTYPAFERQAFEKIFPAEALERLPDYGSLSLPASERFCDELITLLHSYLLSPRESLAKIVEAVKKIKDNLDELKGR